MSNKREYGQYYTVNNPFQHELFKKWMELAHKANDVILEPFAGANNILKLIEDAGYKCEWKCYDIDPPLDNSFPKYGQLVIQISYPTGKSSIVSLIST